jgi:hypothetical protein
LDAIAYINTGWTNPNCSVRSSYAVQEKCILSYCSKHQLQLVKIFHENGSIGQRQYAAWTALDDFLRRKKTPLDLLLVHSSGQLGNNIEEINSKLLFLKEVYQLRVLNLDDCFITKVVESINGSKRLHIVNKQICELLLRYLVTFRAKRMKFMAQDFFIYWGLDLDFMQQSDESTRDLYQQYSLPNNMYSNILWADLVNICPLLSQP